MARFTQNTNQLSSPIWAGDYFDREHMLPGGARLAVAEFVSTNTVPSGTVVGRTLAERDAGTGYGPAAAADDEIYLTCFDVYDITRNPDVELYRPNSIVKETFVPGWAGLAAGVVTKLRAAYICTTGAA